LLYHKELFNNYIVKLFIEAIHQIPNKQQFHLAILKVSENDILIKKEIKSSLDHRIFLFLILIVVWRSTKVQFMAPCIG